MDARHADRDIVQSADARKRFTVDEVFRLQEAQIFSSGDYELIDGDLIAVAAKKNFHELAKRRLARFLMSALPPSFAVAVEATLFLSDVSAPEPDLMIHDDGLMPEDVRGSDVALLIEIADESLPRDLGRKAALYAEHGVREYWVIEADTRRTHVHVGPLPEGRWRQVRIVDADEALPVAVQPGLAVVLSDL
jgi:Uma2 family endonuclease